MVLRRASILLAAWLLGSSVAHANSGGMTGRSTPPGCNDCHSGGAVPTVELLGPDTLRSGQTAIYTLVMKGGAGVQGGLNVSTDNGATLTSIGPQGTRLFNRQLTHTSPKRFSGGEVRWDFRVTAPCSGTVFGLSAAGLSANGANRDNGDFAAFDALTISVTPDDCPDAGILPDAGARPDAATSGPDGGTGDGVRDAGTGTLDEETAGCGCASGGAPEALVASLALVALRGRRARREHGCRP